MDKLEKEIYLSLKETEQLCHLFMDCRLTRLEEAELLYLLEKLPYSSPIIDEVREMMSIEMSLASKSTAKDDVATNKRKRYGIKTLIMIAASVVLLLSIGISAYLHSESEDDFYCQVYSYGKEISRDKAVIIAEDELERIDSFLEHIKDIEEEQQYKIESL